jgi:hypothetical protein
VKDWISELNERSKDDRAIIVGSEVRALVAEIARLQAQVTALQGKVGEARAELEVETGRALQSHARALAAEAEVARLTREREDYREKRATEVENAVLASRAQK